MPTDPLLPFKRYEGEHLDPPISIDHPKLLALSGGHAQPMGDGIVGVRMVAGALDDGGPRRVGRQHVLELVMPADAAAMFATFVFRAALAAGHVPPEMAAVDAEIVEGDPQ